MPSNICFLYPVRLRNRCRRRRHEPCAALRSSVRSIDQADTNTQAVNYTKMGSKQPDSNESNDSTDEVIIYTHGSINRYKSGKFNHPCDTIYISDDDVVPNAGPTTRKNMCSSIPSDTDREPELPAKLNKQGPSIPKNMSSSNPSRRFNKPNHSSKLIKRGPYGPQYVGGYNNLCVFGNEVEMSRENLKRLKAIAGTAKRPIPCYVCTLNKAFTTRNKRMYFSVPFTDTYLKQFLDEPIDHLLITNPHTSIKHHVRVIMGQDKRVTITTNWSQFVLSAKLKEGNICVCAYSRTKGDLALAVHLL